ncbi:reductase [Limosilactobacillus sp.]|jgi:riboflavin biosynthesis RibT protein|uniref:reductase n=1 Tax=Limosilactobacillus sp. TaxID=2773925 RepID=UPI0025C4E4E0|nr:reductase [Limosilactobacillus sp.]MCH3922688.1 reductase [Limosilactobacillus sp.]MCH3927371.1 reductase [Limosilactobacillus sp.]
MLVRYRKDYQKIALGLLSLIPELRDNHRFRDELDWALAEGRVVYLWKDQEDNHFIAVAILDVGDDYVLVRRLSFTPSERSGHNVYALLTAIKDEYPGCRLMGTMATQPLITAWGKANE